MGFKDFVKNNFFEVNSDKEEEVKEVNKPTQNKNFPNFNPISTAVPNLQQLPPDEGDSKKFKEHFNQLLKDSNLPGPDYYEFKQTIDAMGSLPESSSFPAALAALSVQGLNFETLISSAQQYLKILEEDNSAFEASLNEKAQSEVKGKQLEIETLKKANEEKALAISKLTTEINENNNKIQDLSADAARTEEKLKQTQSNYLFAYQTFQLNIKKDIEKINTLCIPKQ